MDSKIDLLIISMGVLAAILLAVIVMVRFIANVYMPFADDRDFIRMEIARSHGNERVHWEHELHRLYMSKIPFIGEYLVKRNKEKNRQQRESLRNQKQQR